MNTTPEPENFDALCRLLKLKRHEQPPPGYFDSFRRQVIARIQADGRTAAVGLEVPWLQAVWEWFGGRPALAGLFGAGICMLLIVGMTYSGRPPALPEARSAVASEQPVPRGMALSTLFDPGPGSVMAASSTNPVAAPQPANIFDQIQPSAVPASFDLMVPPWN